jgi:very-short-patch-repair endonuclease
VAWQGVAWLGKVWLGKVLFGGVWQGRQGMDYWQSFNQYDQEQRRLRAEREQSLAEQQRRKQEVHQAQLSQMAASLQAVEQQRRETQHLLPIVEVKPATTHSPIEDAFYEAWCEKYPSVELIRQYRILKYRVDFAHLDTKLVIELDGHPTHHTRKERNRDYQRQHTIENEGWYFIRFTGSQVFDDVNGCIDLAYSRITAR